MSSHPEVTPWTFERLTAIGRSAVAVWCLRGVTPDHYPALSKLGLPVRSSSHQQLRLASVGNEPSEHCVFVFTNENEIELQSHGGSAVANRMSVLLERAGGIPLTHNNFDEECWNAVSNATTKRVAVRLAQLADGELRAKLEEIRNLPDSAIAPKLQQIMAATESASVLVRGVEIAIVGLPNAGKSSLMNRLAGYERSLTDPRPGATRDVVGLTTAFNGYPGTLRDTAGLRESNDTVERLGIAKAESVAQSANIVLLVIDSNTRATADTRSLLDRFPNALVVAHKSDLPDMSGINWPANTTAVSSATAAGIEELQDNISRQIEQSAPDESAPFLCSDRQRQVAESLIAAAQKSHPLNELWHELLA